MTKSAVLFPPKALTRSGTCKMPRELVLLLKIAQGRCPSVTRLLGLFVYCNGTCRPKWSRDSLPAGGATIVVSRYVVFLSI